MKNTAERYLASSGSGILGVVDCIQFLNLTLGIVHDNNAKRAQYGHNTPRSPVEIVANRVFELCNVNDRVTLRHTDGVAEISNSFRRITAPSKPAQRGHARIVPPIDGTLRHKREQLSLAQDGIAEIQPSKFNLNGARRYRQLFQAPIVKWTVIFEFQRAKRMRNVLERIGDWMCIVVHRVDHPFRSLAIMRHIHYAENDGIAHVDVRRCHVDLCAKHVRSILELSGMHALE